MAQPNNNDRFARPWDLFELKKLKLYGKPWSAADRRLAPSIKLYVVNGNPRFQVYMNKGGTAPAIPIAMDPIIFSYLMESLLAIADNPEADKISLQIKASYLNGQKLDKPTVVAAVTVGRDANKVVYLSIQVKGEQPAVFEFMPSYFAELIGADGENLTPARASNICAKGWAKLMFNLVGHYLVTHVTDPEAGKEKKPYNPQGNGGGGYNNNGNNNGGNNNASNSNNQGFDSDIPF